MGSGVSIKLITTSFQTSPYQWGHECFTIRAACAEDVPALAEIKSRVWPDEDSSPEQITRVLNSADHLTIVAEHAGSLAGFVDSFPTHSPAGLRREVDLLAVSPFFRGRHLGEALVRASVQYAGNIPSRALIQTGNIASRMTFTRCGFSCGEQVHRLYVSSEKYTPAIEATPDACLIKVVTMNYPGIWLENSFTTRDLLAARWRINQEDISLAGAVIPADLEDACQSAVQGGYHFIAEYQWWKKEGDHETN